MIRATPYSDPEFLRQLHIQPFDHEADMANERFRQNQASLVYRVRQREVIRRRRQRQILCAILFVVVCFAAGFIGACL